MEEKHKNAVSSRTSSRRRQPSMTDTSGMRRMSVLHRNDKVTEYGQPGSFSGIAHRTFLVRWRRLSLTGRLGLTALLVAAGGIIGYAGTSTPVGAGVGAGIVLAIWLMTIALFTTPGALTTIFIIFITTIFMPLLGSIYTGSVSGYFDPVGGALALFFAYSLSVYIGLRWGRGRGWVTVLLLSTALLLIGPSLLVLVPELGLNAARLSLALVLLARCGGFAWISGTTGILWDRIRHGKDNDSILDASEADPEDVSLAWERQATAEKETAKALQGLGPDYTVFHDVIVPKTKQHIGQVVAGPTGLKMIVSAHSLGIVHVDPKAGLVVPHVDMEQLSWLLIGQRVPLAKALRISPKDIELIIAIHGSSALERMTVAAMDLDGVSRKAAVNITVVGTENLLPAVSEGFMLWSDLKVERVVRQGRMRIISAIIPQCVDVDIPTEAELAVLDVDGNVIQRSRTTSKTSDPGSYPVSQWRQGDKVKVETSQGLMTGLRIVGDPRVDTTGELIVKVCTEEDWEKNNGDTDNPVTLLRCFTFPASSVLYDSQ